jgi:hypothetical protein
MRITALFLAVALLGCRGEKTPRDYQNSPPAATHPVTTSSGTPTAHGMPGAAPEPSTGVEGKNVTGQPVNATTPTTTIKDNAPTATTATTGT